MGLPQKSTIEIILEPWHLGEGSIKAVVVHQGMQSMEVTGSPTVVAAAIARWMATGGELLLEERAKLAVPFTGPLGTGFTR